MNWKLPAKIYKGCRTWILIVAIYPGRILPTLRLWNSFSVSSFKRTAVYPAAMASSYFFSAFSFSIIFVYTSFSPIVMLIYEIIEFFSFGNKKHTSRGGFTAVPATSSTFIS